MFDKFRQKLFASANGKSTTASAADRLSGPEAEGQFVESLAALEGAPEDLHAPSPRKQHYAFAHHVLHRHFFGDPEGLIGFLSTPRGQQGACDVWERLGAIESFSTGAVDACELKVSPHTFDNRWGVLISMPTPIDVTEAYFIALVGGVWGVDAARYFVLELMSIDDSGQAQAVLCEWLEGNRRRNHDKIISPSEVAFCSLIDEQLDEERNRVNAGAQPVVAPTWDMKADPDRRSVISQGGAYRLHLCGFAFGLLAPALAGGGEWFRSADTLAVQSRVDALWDTAAALWRTKHVGPIAARPQVYRREVAGTLRNIIRMPPSLSPPEPEFILLPDDTRHLQIYLLELAKYPQRIGILAAITVAGLHGVLEEIDTFDEEAFVSAIEDRIRGQARTDMPRTNIRQHILLYLEISNACQPQAEA